MWVPLLHFELQALTRIKIKKEQAENDYQNLVCCIMMDQMIELQDAVDFVTDMLESRVNEYINLKASLPSFKGEVDSELARYLTGIGNIIQGGIAWSYLTSRMFITLSELFSPFPNSKYTFRVFFVSKSRWAWEERDAHRIEKDGHPLWLARFINFRVIIGSHHSSDGG